MKQITIILDSQRTTSYSEKKIYCF